MKKMNPLPGRMVGLILTVYRGSMENLKSKMTWQASECGVGNGSRKRYAGREDRRNYWENNIFNIC
jgi:hypothetical protein